MSTPRHWWDPPKTTTIPYQPNLSMPGHQQKPVTQLVYKPQPQPVKKCNCGK